jgi:hypothetical protein
MLYRVIFTLFTIMAVAHAAEEGGADPCLSEDYAEANCMLHVTPPSH